MKNTKKLKEFILLPGLGQLVLSGARPLIGILLGLLAGAGLIALSGVNPLDAYKALLQGALGSPQSFSNVLVRASPLLLGGVGAAIGIKTGVWNIGTEGYMYAGAIAAPAADHRQIARLITDRDSAGAEALTRISMVGNDMALAGIISTQLVHRQFVASPRTSPPLGERDNVKVVARGRASRRERS